jgi:CPA1 family monovalent cation:H+ antiporter
VDLHVTLLLLASLLTVVSLLQPLAARLSINASILVAVVGIAIGLAAAYARQADPDSAIGAIARVFTDAPVNSSVFLFVLLPVLIFSTALNISVPRIIEDSAPILLLAVVAVVIETLVIGVALAPAAGVSLVVALLLGSIVSTTDPVAVVGIFRDVGAPSRLSRLLEGESLLNDAAAITLFAVLLNLLLGAGETNTAAAVWTFIRNFAGGLALGYLGARLVATLLGWLPDLRLAQMTLTLALPYIVFILGEREFGVSGVVATVTAGLAMNAAARPRIAPEDWQFLRDLWQQLDFWASSLIFILASLLVPRLLVDIGWTDAFLLGVLLLASLGARAFTLFGLIPTLSAFRLSQPIDTRFKVVILWGGLRGAVTLALALAVTESAAVPREVQRFIAVLSTGFVLFTLLVNGTTLRPLIKLLGLDRLSGFDRALREQVLALARGRVAEAVTTAGHQYGFPEAVVTDVAAAYSAPPGSIARAGNDDDQRLIGLLALATQERELILRHFADRDVAGRIVEEMLTDVGRLIDRTRARGPAEYLAAAKRTVDFTRRFRLAHYLHRRFHLDGPLVDALADRFERLFVSRIVLDELIPYIDSTLTPLVGPEVAVQLKEALRQRQTMTGVALSALRVQHPEYAELLERRLLHKVALRHEDREHRALFQEGVIGPELYAALRRDLAAAQSGVDARPDLDLGLETRALVAKVPLFAKLPPERLMDVARLLQPRFAVPGEVLIREGEHGGSMFFISSGSVDVRRRGGDRTVTLGRGEFFGEMALIFHQPRGATVTALGYSQLLELREIDFRRLLRSSKAIRRQIDRVAHERQRMNEGQRS